MKKQRLITLSLFVLVAAASRLLPHEPNFTPIAAIALFAGANYSSRWLAFAVPIAALLIGDAILGFYPGMWINYLAFAAVVCVGFALRGRQKLLLVFSASIFGALVFFTISNFSAWATGQLYPMTWNGLMQCFAAGVPMFRNTLLSDLFYTVLLFGGYALAERGLNVVQPYSRRTA